MTDYSILFSRRATDRKVDFRPDMAPGSPDDQARRLSRYLDPNSTHVFTDDDITDCPQALDALREYQYRKIHTNTSHADFVALDESDPQHIDWAIHIHEISTEMFNKTKRNNRP